MESFVPSSDTPAVFIEPLSTLPASIAEVPSAVPAFVGCTRIARDSDGASLSGVPVRVTSLHGYEQFFGEAPEQPALATVTTTQSGTVSVTVTLPEQDFLHACLWHYFDNGGGPCYVVSVNSGTPIPRANWQQLIQGLETLKPLAEPTLLLVPEAVYLAAEDFGRVCQAALRQCAELGDRFSILDVHPAAHLDWVQRRELYGFHNLEYGAAYFPFLRTNKRIFSADVIVDHSNGSDSFSKPLSEMHLTHPAIAAAVEMELANHPEHFTLPASAAVAGAIARNDRDRGVWKAPANIALSGVIKPVEVVSEALGDALNSDPVSGKSINAIRAFTGKGTRIWGARTLAGINPEQRYVPVRRLGILLVTSINSGLLRFSFETNDARSWARIRTMIENYLTAKWRDGALQGDRPGDAFFVHCGLGSSMTAEDIAQGQLRVVVGFAPLKPAEFIVLKLSQSMVIP
jgi:phage tail sheath protein FI